MGSPRPVIGMVKPENEDFFAFLAFKVAVIQAGGTPLIISAKDKNYKDLKVDGYLFGGGKDVFPGHYNQPPKDDYIYDQDRDNMEIQCARIARAKRIPSLGICRGAQLMNVACGGSLHMDIASAYEDASYPDGFWHHALFRKEITIRSGGLLHGIVGKENLKVNSIHKQAIAEIGSQLDVEAWESNGIVQAVSLKEHPFFLGVQFHPEFMIYRSDFRLIFKAFIQATKKAAS